MPVEDRSVSGTISRDATTKSREVTITETGHETIESNINAEADILVNDNRRQKSVYEQSASPVALAFLQDADKYTSVGDNARAVASLERGLDIEPKNPWLWNRLASERLQQKMWNKAITLAKKSNAFSAGHNQLQKDNWQIIVEARVALGDKEGARKANKMIEHFSTDKT